MPLDITFTLSDSDLEHFRKIVEQSKLVAGDAHNAEKIREATIALIAEAKKSELPDFISDRLVKLEVLANMVVDEEWQLEDEEKHSILSAVAYFSNPEDLIPDHVPGLGFLDDAIMAEMVIQRLQHEIDAYQEFCEYRMNEEQRRADKGVDSSVGREDWLADKRAVLHSRMRSRRSQSRSSGNWRMGLW